MKGTDTKTAEEINQLFQEHYNRLLYHVRRHIRHDEMAGGIPEGALDPRDIVDEAARQAIANADQKPPGTDWVVWLFHLLHQELNRQRRLLKEKREREIPIERRTILPEDKRLEPLEEIVVKEMEPEIVRNEDVLPNPEVTPPDEIAAEKDLLETLQTTIQNWPRPEREIFELYFLEGFEPEEISRITGQPVDQVQRTIAAVRQRLPEDIREELAT